MILVFAVDENWNIGHQGGMLFHLSKDLKNFKKLTTGNIVVMGRKTLDSLPKGRPLPNRDNVVLSRNPHLQVEGAHIVHDFTEMDLCLKALNPQGERTVFLIGGGNLVDQLFDRCDEALITKIHRTQENYDTSIPNLDEREGWDCIEEGELQEEDGIFFQFTHYRRRKS